MKTLIDFMREHPVCFRKPSARSTALKFSMISLSSSTRRIRDIALSFFVHSFVLYDTTDALCWSTGRGVLNFPSGRPAS